jgi:hypothetical protein
MHQDTLINNTKELTNGSLRKTIVVKAGSLYCHPDCDSSNKRHTVHDTIQRSDLSNKARNNAADLVHAWQHCGCHGEQRSGTSAIRPARIFSGHIRASVELYQHVYLDRIRNIYGDDLMPTLSISVSSSTVASGTRTYNITDADLQSVIDWGKASFASSLSTAPTNNQVMAAWVQSWVTGTKMAVDKFELDAARAAATAGTITISKRFVNRLAATIRHGPGRPHQQIHGPRRPWPNLHERGRGRTPVGLDRGRRSSGLKIRHQLIAADL